MESDVYVAVDVQGGVKVKVQVEVHAQGVDDGYTSSATRLDLVDLP